jgi:hypothetical protein
VALRLSPLSNDECSDFTLTEHNMFWRCTGGAHQFIPILLYRLVA